ncbi:endonuclease III [Candidatus Micrarchaeota archaeon CG_4_10_14_0_8_um_filter_60_7]|nr:MAG: endonuclease III [Candidatus Micrarchaeota archaeon CG_4_10_14_0_8_um_filter_60_7]
MKKTERAAKVLKRLERGYGTPAWGRGGPFKTLVATILSTQCTDRQVDKVLPTLFKKFRTPRDFANADLRTLEKMMRSTGYYHQKAKHLKAMARKLVSDYGGRVPASMAELVKLPGVGRKTANIVLSQGFGKTEGIAVDTHVWRLSRRLGFSKKNTQLGIERDLMALFEKKDWGKVNELLVQHGRAVCTARKPECCACAVRQWCPSREC